jgi:hypothetical protein
MNMENSHVAQEALIDLCDLAFLPESMDYN